MDSKKEITTEIHEHPLWRAFDERFSKLESRLLAKKTVLNFDEAAEYTGLSKSFLYKLTSASKIPHFKPSGKNIFFDRTEIETWLKRNPIKTNEEIEREASEYVTLKGGSKS